MKKADSKKHLELCFDSRDRLDANNRFDCMERLEQIIRQKKGGYNEKERRRWLGILYSCLRAPDCYYESDFTAVSKKAKKKLLKYNTKLVEFQQIIKQERDQHRSIYTYLACIRDLFNRTEAYCAHKSEHHNSLAEKLQTAMRQALDERISENPDLEPAREGYEKVLKDTFQAKQSRLNHPVFFLFLPYYLFFELGKCEGIISETDAFSVPQLDKNEFNWTIRHSPFLINDEDEEDQMANLFTCVENTLCKALHDCGYRSIGQKLMETICSYESAEIPDKQAAEFKEYKIDDALDFSAPLWNYDSWVRCFRAEFDTEMNSLLLDLHQLFNLTFRPSSLQSKHAIDKILQKYVDCSTELGERVFNLAELLKALCNVYNLQCFNADDPFDDESLQQATDTIMDFLIETGIYSAKFASYSPDEKWMLLLRYGYPDTPKTAKFKDNNLNHGLSNPSRVLYQAIVLRTYASVMETPKRYGFIEFYPISCTLEKISDSIFHILCSEKNLLRDISHWGGVKIELDEKYTPTLRDAFHVWSIWHTDQAAQFKEYFNFIERHSDHLSGAISNLQPYDKKAVEVELSTFNFDLEKSEELANCKQQLFAAIPELKKIFGLPKNLDDFRYTCILYFLFRALKDQMCRQAFSLCVKLLQLS